MSPDSTDGSEGKQAEAVRSPEQGGIGGESTVWAEFSQRNAGHAALSEDVIHALPMRLIESLTRHAPGLLSADDVRFEQDLTRSSGSGFFLKRLFHSPLLPDPGIEPDDGQRQLIERQRRNENALPEAMAEDMRAHGSSEVTIQRFFEQRRQYRERAEQRRRGYAGWLITSPAFQASRMDFCDRWGDRIEEAGGMPALPEFEMVTRLPVVPKNDREFYTDYMTFFRRWSLETLSTWQLPLPMRASPVQLAPYNQTILGEAGLKLFVPWYLLGDKDLKLHELAEHHASYGDVAHLSGWLQREDPGKKGWGYARFSTMLQLYVCLNRGLHLRYPKRIRGRTSQIDEAFTAFQLQQPASASGLDSKAESTRKIRQQLNRRLNRCRETLKEQCHVDLPPAGIEE